MNQAIQFPEREWWNGEQQAVCFIALVNGLQLTCAISAGSLTVRYGQHISPLAIFQQHRWDLEDEAGDAIRNGVEDDQGWVWLF
ncbi:hypothetical protein BL250_14395 [Erwinia sp. OLTSP20]|uniref:DUF1488 domain-containing protein n=1 Tax=unclassified Erwinia TaxID=2622719 RepID=UPI000C191FCC|nr:MULTISPECIES: DUF1488 domain-containing protein [unclassified Erwinia]PIJ49136.1 hypothetical protein BV501_14250 [Erwinia sp. OAMSP11]PIJ67716.1 hypothetical protein BK416_17075 [Erwinia sp. OLSSP12]PIJ79057.1 hypothetical protein BLD47_15890 [Erwinia sp. OLCASP19]PIJ80172.1 hypothetical protein BLD46_15985 [Erwinia sp. OLMTSP26]PIJ83202.1 hypothetical protein BLD49_13615 [Erwinia sp. OLMDSP33]